MMRLTWATVVAILISTSTIAQQQAVAQQPAAANAPAARVATQGQSPARPTQPFPPLNAAERAQLTQLLTSWEAQSKGTKSLDCKFTRWHYDMFAAPAGIFANRADGVVKYAKPDKGLFRVDSLVFFAGMKNDKPQFKPQPGQFGEHWVCNGAQLIEFDRSKQECRIQDLPPSMRGQAIINSPLPFVFNLDAKEIQNRYWVRLVQAPKPGIFLVEAWPKRQEDRAQYKLVQIALNGKTFLPQALLMYAPNFDAKTAPKWDHYEFTDVKRNAIGAGIQKFMGNFIPEKPPSNWKIVKEKFLAPQEANPGNPIPGNPNPPPRQAVAPAGAQPVR